MANILLIDTPRHAVTERLLETRPGHPYYLYHSPMARISGYDDRGTVARIITGIQKRIDKARMLHKKKARRYA
jgi:hypothetical protein